MMMFGVIQGRHRWPVGSTSSLSYPWSVVQLRASLLRTLASSGAGTHLLSYPWSASRTLLRVGFLLAVVLLGIHFMGDSWWLPVLFIAGLAIYLFKAKELPLHTMSVATVGMFLFFLGISTYGVILIRANSDIPMNQNSPSDVFSLRCYLSHAINTRQYPLIYGQTCTLYLSTTTKVEQ